MQGVWSMPRDTEAQRDARATALHKAIIATKERRKARRASREAVSPTRETVG